MKDAKSFVVNKKNSWDEYGYAISKDNALHAIEMQSKKAIELFSECCPLRCEDITCPSYDIINNECTEDCKYIKKFKKEIMK